MMSISSVLILEDDPILATELDRFLSNHGLRCTIATDGALLFKQNLEVYDLFILDINVPTFDGISVCRKIREQHEKTPILMLTAYGAVTEKVRALGYGADDYLVKPCHFDELLARIGALLRRTKSPEGGHDMLYRLDDLLINYTQMTVFRDGREVALTPKEYKLLEVLARANGRAVSKQQISLEVWEANFETSTNTIEVYINFLRSKIDRGFDHKLIHTRKGYGYFLKSLRI